METWLDLNTVNLLGRVDSRINKDHMINSIAKAFRLGKVISFRQIHEGFEDFNGRLKTTKGTFFVKIFSQNKSFKHVKDNIEALGILTKKRYKIPKLHKTYNGKFIYHYETKEGYMALVCITDFFKGKSFFKAQREPKIKEIADLTKEIAQYNMIDFKPRGVYDTWVVQNITQEYKKKKDFLEKEDLKLVQDIIPFFNEVDYSKYTRGFIHNDLQRSNILVNKKGEMRIIDFSVMEFNAIILELAIFIALFCINPDLTSIKQAELIINMVLEEYQKVRKLTKKDIAILPQLIYGTYAINNIAASFEKYGKENDNEETDYWLTLGRNGMKFIKKLYPNLF